MNEKPLQFLKVLDSLPEQVDVFFGSDLSEEVTEDLSSSHNVSKDYILDLIYDTVISGFDLELIRSRIAGFFKNDSQRTNEMYMDYLGKMLLPLDPFLVIDVRKELDENGVNPDMYDNIRRRFEIVIEKETAKRMEKIVAAQESIDYKEEKRDIFTIIEHGIVDLLGEENLEAMANINGSLINIFNHMPKAAEDLEKNLLDNKTLFSEQEIVIHGNEVRPTVGNWLRDFIAVEGAGAAEAIDISNYFADSPNVKKLDPDKRDDLRKLIKFYLNVKYYPDSMADKPPTDWHIIPVDQPAEEISRASVTKNEAKAKTKTEEPQRTEPLETKPKPAAPANDRQIARKPGPKTDKNEQIANLKTMVADYPEGSLERLAIEEEIKKLEK